MLRYMTISVIVTSLAAILAYEFSGPLNGNPTMNAIGAFFCAAWLTLFNWMAMRLSPRWYVYVFCMPMRLALFYGVFIFLAGSLVILASAAEFVEETQAINDVSYAFGLSMLTSIVMPLLVWYLICLPEMRRNPPTDPRDEATALDHDLDRIRRGETLDR